MAVGVVVGGAIASSFTLHPRARGELAAETVRQAAVIVAHVLHTPMAALDEADVEDVLEWADDAAALTRALSR